MGIMELNGTFDESDFFGVEAVKLIDERVDLAVGGGDLLGECVFVMRGLRGGLGSVQAHDVIHQLDEFILGGFVRLNFGRDHTDGYLLHVLVKESIAILAGTHAKRDSDVGDSEPAQATIQKRDQILVCGAQAVGGV